MNPSWYTVWLEIRTDEALLNVLREDRAWVLRARRDGVYPSRCHRQEVRLAKKECRRRGLDTRDARPQ